MLICIFSKMNSNQSPVSGPAVNDISYIRDLQLIMHALGDNPSPLEASAVVIEKILYQQLKLLLVKAYEVSAIRKAKVLGHEDLLFLMRKDPVKIHRLLNYLAVKDLKSSATRVVIDSESNENEPGPPKSSREQCLKFLREIDTTGTLTDKRFQLFDTVKHERNVRAELMSQSLDQDMYQEYSAARRFSFNIRPGHRFFKLQEWLQSKGDKELPVLPKLKSLAYDIFCYLAYETVSQVIDLAFLVRQDAAATVNPLSYHLAGFSRRPRNYPSQYAAQVGDKEQYCAPPLTPAEIEEAVARYWSPVLYPWSAFTRNVPPQIPERLLAC